MRILDRMNPLDAERDPRINCRTCFALIDPNTVRCPKCSAPQDWRRHVTLVNVLAILMIGLLVVGLSFLVGWMKRSSEPPKATVRTSFTSNGMDFSTQVVITNPADRQLLVRLVVVDVMKGDGLKVSYVFDEKDFGDPFTVEAGQIGTRTFALGKGPGFIVYPVTQVVLYHFDGRVEQLVDSSKTVIGNDRVIPPMVQRLLQPIDTVLNEDSKELRDE